MDVKDCLWCTTNSPINRFQFGEDGLSLQMNVRGEDASHDYRRENYANA